MSNQTENNMIEEESTERNKLTITIPLDPAHRRMDLALREQGINVDKAVSQLVVQNIEAAIYQLMQTTKYEEQ
jgi:hypothetical protein